MTPFKILKTFMPYVFLAVLFIGLFIINSFIVHDDFSLASPPPNALNEGWVFIDTDGSKHPIKSLPSNLDVAANNPLRIETTLPDAFTNEQTLRIRTSLANITVTINDEIVYAHDFEERMTMASLWHMIDIPAGHDGDTITLTFTSPYNMMSGRVNTIAYGTQVQLHEDLFETFGLRLIIIALLFIIGLVMMLVAFLMRNRMHPAYACLGLSAVLLSIWLFAESRLMQFFIGNTFLIGSLSYIVLPLIILPIHGFFRKVIIQKYRWVVTTFVILHLSAASIVYIAHIIGFRAFFETTFISLTTGAISMLGLLVVLILEYHLSKSAKLRRALIVYSIFLFFAIVEFIMFFQQAFMQTSAAAFIGVLIGIIAGIFYFAQFILSQYRASLEKDVYEKLAFIDPLTNGANRMAYTRDTLEAFERAKKGITITLIYFDLNNLKTINDNFGHHYGDASIKALHDMIIEAFGDLGSCYRLGGDEFACLIENVEQSDIMERKKDFMVYVNTYNTETKYPFSVAIGLAMVDVTKDNHIEDVMRRADKAMYKDKAKSGEDFKVEPL